MWSKYFESGVGVDGMDGMGGMCGMGNLLN